MTTNNRRVTTLFLADDDAAVRRTLRTFFADRPDYKILGEASDGASAIELCRQLKPDVALLDIEMPLLGGLDAAKTMLDEAAVRCVIMLTSFNDDVYVQRALEAGAFGYLTKPFEPQKILPTIEFCIHRSREMHLLKKEVQHLRRRIGGRSTVDHAKLMLMETRNLSETEAYQFIKELSRRKNVSMERISQALVAKLERAHE